MVEATLTEAEAAYYGGLFDGEGYVGIDGADDEHSHRLRVTVTNIHKPTLLSLLDVFGGSVYANTGKNKNQAWQWQASGEGACRFLEAVEQHLRIKHAVAVMGIAFYRGVGQNPDRQDLVKAREWFRQSIKGRNHGHGAVHQ